MAWDGSRRAQQLPKDWKQRREAVKARAGGICEATLNTGARCTAPGTDCDHIQRGNNHNYNNLQWLCAWHHNRKTQGEASQFRRRGGSPWHPRDKHPARR